MVLYLEMAIWISFHTPSEMTEFIKYHLPCPLFFNRYTLSVCWYDPLCRSILLSLLTFSDFNLGTEDLFNGENGVRDRYLCVATELNLDVMKSINIIKGSHFSFDF